MSTTGSGQLPPPALPLGERVEFDLIATTESKHDLRVWTDGERVVWQDHKGPSGYMPAGLFRLAALHWAIRCEQDACPDDDDEKRDDFLHAWTDSMRQPIELAAAHPYWTDPDDPRNDLRFGFASMAVSTTLDLPPTALKPREQPDAPDAIDLVHFRRLIGCLPFVEPDAGCDETQAAMRAAADEIERLRAEVETWRNRDADGWEPTA